MEPTPPTSTTTTPSPAAPVTTPGTTPSGVISGQPEIVAQTAPSGSSKGMFWVIVAAFLVVAVLVGIGVFMYTQMRQTNTDFQQITDTTQPAQPTTSAPASLIDVSNDLSSVIVDDVSADFDEVDREMEEL